MSMSRATTGLLLDRRLELRLALDGLRQGHGIGRVLRHELGELVDLPVGHLQHAAHVAQHAAGEQGAEGDDLPDLLLAVALLHVLDHTLAALDAEVDVEVRHRDAFGLRKRSNSRLNRRGSRSVMVSA
jgi:hypothetical protein